MKVEIRYIEEVFRKQQELAFKLKHGAKMDSYKKSLIPYLLILALGIIAYYNDNYLAYLFILIGTFLVVNNLYGNYFYIKLKRKFRALVDAEAEEYRNVDEPIIWQLTEKEFIYKDQRMTFKLIWSKFKMFEIVEDTLILHPFQRNFLPFLLDKSEVSSEEFKAIYNFISNKLDYAG